LELRAQPAWLLLARASARLVRTYGERREPALLVLANAGLEGIRSPTGKLGHRTDASPSTGHEPGWAGTSPTLQLAGVSTRLGRRWARRDCVAADAVARVQIRHQAREREHSRLGHGVVGHSGGGPLAGGRGDVHDRTASPLAHRRHGGADRADVAEHVQLPDV